MAVEVVAVTLADLYWHQTYSWRGTPSTLPSCCSNKCHRRI